MRTSPKSPALIPRQKSFRRTRLSITLEASLVGALDEGGPVRGEQIARDLRRYYRLLAESRVALRPRFSPERLSLILDACNGWVMDLEAPQHLWIQVAEEIRRNRLDTKWAVADAAGLIQRLQALTWLESLALADAVQRFWHGKETGTQMIEPDRVLE